MTDILTKINSYIAKNLNLRLLLIFMKHKISISELLNFEDQDYKKALKPLRKRIGSLQIAELQALFYSGIRFPDKQLREKLGEKLGLTPRTIQVWFQNRRQNSKFIEIMQDDDDIQTVSILQSLRLALK